MVMVNWKEEFGGYLPFERYFASNGHHYKPSDEWNVSNLNCGRSCFFVAAKSLKPRKVYIPYFTCIDTAQPFLDLEIEVDRYFLDADFLPKNVVLQNNELILWTNYYGNASSIQLKTVAERFHGQLILDNCHAFFSPPIKGAINCYSARKFFGVSDGAYLVTENSIKHCTDGLPRDTSYNYMQHLFKQNEQSTNHGYQLSLINEKRLEQNYGLMSLTTNNILNAIDYKKIFEIRQENFRALHDLLSSFNHFAVNVESKTLMYYPFKCPNRDLRDVLLKRGLYSPTWWKHVFDRFGDKVIESVYSIETVLLPVDQRYDTNDMIRISELVKDSLGVR